MYTAVIDAASHSVGADPGGTHAPAPRDTTDPWNARQRQRSFWRAQLLGWGAIAAVNYGLQRFGAGEELAAFNTATLFVSGFVVTTGYRYLARAWPWGRWPGGRLMAVWGGSVAAQVAVLLTGIALAMTASGVPFGPLTLLANAVTFSVLLGAWTALYIASQYLRRYSRAEFARVTLRSELRAAQLTALRAQVNPHFTFNALNNIRALIDEDPARARAAVDDFADLLRYRLTAEADTTVTLAEELTLVRRYIDVVSIQLGGRLRYHETVAESLAARTRLPALAVQLLVENAVRHGVEPSAHGGEVSVRASEVEDGQTVLTVSNPGPVPNEQSGDGSSEREGLGIGLTNLRHRLRLTCGPGARLEVSTAPGGLVTARLELPGA